MAQAKFSVGDRVIFTRGFPAFGLSRGQRARIDRVYVDPEAYDVSELSPEGEVMGSSLLYPEDLEREE